MFTQISNPTALIYDPKTGELLGKATFQLTNETEKNILDFVNNGAPIPALTMLDIKFDPTPAYVPPKALQSYPRKGVFKALFKMCGSYMSLPIELDGTFTTQMRSGAFGTQDFVSSADFKDIHVDSMKQGYM